MLAALFKIFPFVWPFLKEALLGGRNHPMFSNRKKKNGWVKAIIGFLIVIVVALGDAYLTLHKENEALKQQLSTKVATNVSEQSIKLMFCERDVKSITEQLSQLNDDIEAGKYDCSSPAPIQTILQNQPSKLTSPVPKSIEETTKQRAMRKLEELRNRER